MFAVTLKEIANQLDDVECILLVGTDGIAYRKSGTKVIPECRIVGCGIHNNFAQHRSNCDGSRSGRTR